MLHDPSHIEPPEVAKEIVLEKSDTDILRGLAEDWAHIASLSVHKEKTHLWQKLNDLESERPMLWINEIPWNEMNYNEEMTLRCKNIWARSQEDHMRKTIYQWRHMPGDMSDLEKIEIPHVTHNKEATELRLQIMNEVFGDIIQVRTVGQTHIWYTHGTTWYAGGAFRKP